MQIRILDRTPKAEVPEYATSGSGGMDIRSPNDYVLPSRKTLTIPTGLAVWIEDPKFCGMLLSRSGLASRGIVLANSIGLIDSDYQGELKVCLYNRGSIPFAIHRGDRIAQLVIVKIKQIKPRNSIRVVDQFEHETERGTGGFGSTGE